MGAGKAEPAGILLQGPVDSLTAQPIIRMSLGPVSQGCDGGATFR
jgi:hypothetical protein